MYFGSFAIRAAGTPLMRPGVQKRIRLPSPGPIGPGPGSCTHGPWVTGSRFLALGRESLVPVQASRAGTGHKWPFTGTLRKVRFGVRNESFGQRFSNH